MVSVTVKVGFCVGIRTPPSGPNMPAPGSWARPAYRAPVRPAKGLLPVPAARFDGTPCDEGAAVLGVED